MRRIAILGSTGSIGCSTLSVAESYPDRFQIVALAAGGNLETTFQQAMRLDHLPRLSGISHTASSGASGEAGADSRAE